MRIIDLLNKIANGEIEDKRTFNIEFGNGLCRSIYYDKEEPNCMFCLKNCSDDYPVSDEINFDTEIITKDKNIEDNKKIEKLNKKHFHKKQRQLANKINEIIDKINEEQDE